MNNDTRPIDSELQTWGRHDARRTSVANMLEAAGRLRSRKARATATIGGYRFSSYRSAYDGDGNAIRGRDVAITIELADVLVGLAELREWAVPHEADRVEFYYAADGTSDQEGDMAEVVGAFWPSHDWPGMYGGIVLFERLAIDTSRDANGAALASLGEYVGQEFGRRASVMLLKAFPLEFERTGSKVEAKRELLNRRRKAMMRLYGSRLSANRFSPSSDLEGWMWRCFMGPPPLSAPDPEWGKEIAQANEWVANAAPQRC